MPLKYGGLVSTKSNVSDVRHVVMSDWIKFISVSFSLAFCAHAASISGEVSMPVIIASGLCACRHSDTPPVPMPTSSTVFAFVGANAASQTASDVGL